MTLLFTVAKTQVGLAEVKPGGLCTTCSMDAPSGPPSGEKKILSLPRHMARFRERTLSSMAESEIKRFDNNGIRYFNHSHGAITQSPPLLDNILAI
jgi:hypothetical protein